MSFSISCVSSNSRILRLANLHRANNHIMSAYSAVRVDDKAIVSQQSLFLEVYVSQ